jgi:hypothetical protein
MVTFRTRYEPMNWKMIAAGRDVDEIIRNPVVGLGEIQTQLSSLCYGSLRDGKDQENKLLVKALGYAQLTIEYLLHVQDSLAASVLKTQHELDDWRAQAEELSRKEKKSRHTGKKLRECQTTLQAASHMLEQFGVDIEPLRRVWEDRSGGSGGARAPEYVWVPAFLDPYDGKAFQSAEFLKKHMFGRNGQEVRADLQSGRYGKSVVLPHETSVVEDQNVPMTPLLAAPRDAIESAARWIVEEVSGTSAATGAISRKKLLKALQYLRTHPQECELYHFPPPPSVGSAAATTTTVHDLLASTTCVDANSEVNKNLELDWRGVDAHLRCFNEVDAFLRSDLEAAMAAKISAAGRDAVETFEMRAVEKLDDKARRLFEEIDVDGSGEITIEELIAAVKHPVRGYAIRASLGFTNGNDDENEGSISKEDMEQMLLFIERKMTVSLL